jgi:myo-inositol-1(or 4)-monophosphatase
LPAADLDLLVRAARGAGEIAQRYFREDGVAQWDKGEGAGPVSEADLAVNAYLAETLRGARPDYGWLSEESEDDAGRLDAARLFVVDPIDGTRSFLDGHRTWAHSIAVVEAGRATAGVVFLPMHDRLYAAARGAGATLNAEPLALCDTPPGKRPTLLSTKASLTPRFWRRPPPRVERAYRPSLAYRLALVAQGRFDGMLTFRPTWEWDIAAGSLIAAEAGAAVTDRHGAPLRFNGPDPRTAGVVVARPALHAALLGAHDPAS